MEHPKAGINLVEMKFVLEAGLRKQIFIFLISFEKYVYWTNIVYTTISSDGVILYKWTYNDSVSIR